MQLWEIHRNTEVPDIIFPDKLMESTIFSLDETEVHRAAKKHAQVALSCADKLPNEVIQSMVHQLQAAVSTQAVGLQYRVLFAGCYCLKWFYWAIIFYWVTAFIWYM
jgi:hypothetical protein